MVTREEHTVLGKNRTASGREEAFKACAVSFGSNQEGSVFLTVFLRSRPCYSRLSALNVSVGLILLPAHMCEKRRAQVTTTCPSLTL